MTRQQKYQYLISTVQSNFDSQECLLWPFDRESKKRYGKLSIGPGHNKHRTHKVSYSIFKGEIPPRKYVLHTCDQPLCFNPNHLYLGNQKDNMRDCIERGRWVNNIEKTRGSGHRKPGKKNLTVEQVKAIRQLYETTQGATHSIARQFDVCTATIWHIVNRKTYKDVY